MRVTKTISTLALVFALSSTPALAAPEKPQTENEQALDARGSAYDVSAAVMRTAVLDADGKPVGLKSYETPLDALKAGDTAAFVASVKETGDDDAWAILTQAVDAVAADDLTSAREAVDSAADAMFARQLVDYTGSWLTALEGDEDTAISQHRSVDNSLPGIVGDLSLAAMLEGFGRNDEALAIYASLTPGDITAPEHDFDAQGLMFAHIQVVIARRTLLLRRLGRIDEAKAVYQRLADAEPEKAVSYAAAIKSLETGEGFDDEALTPRTAFARALNDLSLSLYQQRLVRAAMTGGDMDLGYDQTKATLDHLAMLLAPENENIREIVIDGLYREALYDGAAHVALTAPTQTARLKSAAAQTLMRTGDYDKARKTLEASLDIAEEDEKLSIMSSAVGMYVQLDDDKTALEVADQIFGLADNPAEQASAHAIKAEALQHFGMYDEALVEAKAALALDDTHLRRMTTANMMGDTGEVDEGLRMMRKELLTRPNDPYMLNTLGYYLVTKTDKYEEGYRVLARSNALASSDPYIADSFGWAKYQLGDFEGARRLIEQSKKELAPHLHWEIEDHLGDIYWRLEREDDAKAAWTRALGELPYREEKAKIKDKLENGMTEPAPEKRELPDVDVDDRPVAERDI